MTDDLSSRLMNFKFKQACRYLEHEPEELQGIVRNLAEDYGDVGWFDGSAAETIWNCLSIYGLGRPE